jgi:hypothetical protein
MGGDISTNQKPNLSSIGSEPAMDKLATGQVCPASPARLRRRPNAGRNLRVADNEL